MNTISKTAFILGLALTIQVCTTTQENKKDGTTAQRKGNFKDFDVTFKGHEFDSKEAKTIKHFTGTTIQIPAQAFVDAQGKPVSGNVKVNYREFHQASEIIASGITMQYDSAGKRHSFETAGMFDIRAEQAGKPVFLAKDKNIKIDLASYKEGAFNFYYLQEYKQEKMAQVHFSAPFISTAMAQDIRPGEDKWQLLQTSTLPAPNKERAEKMAEIDKNLPTEPKQPVAYNDKIPVLDLNIDVKEFPELRAFEGLIWQYAGDLEDAAKNPKKNEWIFDYTWQNIKLEDTGDMQYRLTLAGKDKNFETLIRPTLKGMNYEKAKALFEEKRKQYEADVEKRKDEIAKLKAEKSFWNRQSKFIRSLQIQSFGIYNCDRIFRSDDAIEIAMQLQVPEDKGANDSKTATVYMMFDNNVIQYQALQNKVPHAFILSKRPNKMLVVFQNSNKVAVYSREDFAKLGDPEKMKGKEIELSLKSITEPIKSTAALEELIAKL